jgi:multidrug transporter EmrE-like cation transporter
VNYAYPFLALGFLANALMSQTILGESIPPMRWAALTLIILGVALQAFTGAPKHL